MISISKKAEDENTFAFFELQSIVTFSLCCAILLSTYKVSIRSNDMYDLIIIGAGPAGLYAATCAAMNKINAVLIESSLEIGGQLTLYKEKAVYDMPAFFKINAGELLDRLYLQHAEYQDLVPLHLNTQALDLKEDEHGFTLLTNHGEMKSKTILLANGGGMFQAKKLELPETSHLKNIYYHIKNPDLFKDKEIVILGGGDSAVDWAISLKEVAKKVTLVHRRNDFRAHQLNVEQIRATGNVMTPFVPEAIIGTDHVEAIVLKNTENNTLITLKADALLVFYGVSPVKGKVDQWKVDIIENAIAVKPSMETSRKGVFAVGNSVFYEGKLRMIVTALGEAATAIGSITTLLYPERTKSYKH